MTDTAPAKQAEENKPTPTIESSVEAATRAFALRKYEEAVENYATALELTTEKHGEGSLECANLYFLYGKALLENAISQSAVLGKEDPEAAQNEDEADNGPATSGPDSRFHFGGDGEEEEQTLEQVGEESKEDADGENEEDGGDDPEPEDDFNAAWEVLDLARAFFEKIDDDESRLKLADIHVVLGDVSLETENFNQAITDYTAALKIKSELLPLYSRQLAEAHYKLSMVLDLTSGRLADAVQHAEKALQSVEARLVVLRDTLAGTMQKDAGEAPVDVKGKGKAKASADPLESMTKEELEAQVKEFEALKTDVELKIEDLKSSPEEPSAASAPEMAAKSLDEVLNRHFAGSSGSAAPTVPAGPVNDLTSVVRKKKPAAPPTMPPSTSDSSISVKRKAEEATEDPIALEKKPKLDEKTT